MSKKIAEHRIPEEDLAEQWFSLLHQVIGKVQEAYRDAAKEGLNQKIIAQRLGKKNPEVISRCLSGQKNMTLRTLHDLTRAMNCRLDVSVTRLDNFRPSNRTVAIMDERRKYPTEIDRNMPFAATGGSRIVAAPQKVDEYA